MFEPDLSGINALIEAPDTLLLSGGGRFIENVSGITLEAVVYDPIEIMNKGVSHFNATARHTTRPSNPTVQATDVYLLFDTEEIGIPKAMIRKLHENVNANGIDTNIYTLCGWTDDSRLAHRWHDAMCNFGTWGVLHHLESDLPYDTVVQITPLGEVLPRNDIRAPYAVFVADQPAFADVHIESYDNSVTWETLNGYSAESMYKGAIMPMNQNFDQRMVADLMTRAIDAEGDLLLSVSHLSDDDNDLMGWVALVADTGQ